MFKVYGLRKRKFSKVIGATLRESSVDYPNGLSEINKRAGLPPYALTDLIVTGCNSLFVHVARLSLAMTRRLIKLFDARSASLLDGFLIPVGNSEEASGWIRFALTTVPHAPADLWRFAVRRGHCGLT